MASVNVKRDRNQNAKDAANAAAAKSAQSIGLPEGWLFRRMGVRYQFTSPDGADYNTLQGVIDALGREFMEPILVTLWAEMSKKIGVEDAQTCGLPEGWTVKIYPRAKHFYCPLGIKHASHLAALQAANVSDTGKGFISDKCIKKTITIAINRAVKVEAPSPSPSLASEIVSSAEPQSEADQQIAKRPRFPSTSEDLAVDAEVAGLKVGCREGDPKASEKPGYSLQRCCAGWVAFPTDVEQVSLDLLLPTLESAGWACTDRNDTRYVFSGDVAISIYASAGKLLVWTDNLDAADAIALQYVQLLDNAT